MIRITVLMLVVVVLVVGDGWGLAGKGSNKKGTEVSAGDGSGHQDLNDDALANTEIVPRVNNRNFSYFETGNATLLNREKRWWKTCVAVLLGWALVLGSKQCTYTCKVAGSNDYTCSVTVCRWCDCNSCCPCNGGTCYNC